jgi:regulator of cell morphogenesis and NO signaling
MNITKEMIIGETVAKDYRTASIFQKYHIDFCCKGNRSIEEACISKKTDVNALLKDMNEVINQNNTDSINFNSWPLDLLTDYIEKKHHRYVEEKTPVLLKYLQKVAQVHGEHHPELLEIRRLFNESATILAAHMKKEELVLFPFIRKMVTAHRTHQDLVAPHFGTVQNPVHMMMHEHDVEGDRFRKIAELTNQYNPLEDACNTYRVTYSLLQEFDNDLHLHIHLENNILFPKALELEKEFNSVTA